MSPDAPGRPGVPGRPESDVRYAAYPAAAERRHSHQVEQAGPVQAAVATAHDAGVRRDACQQWIEATHKVVAQAEDQLRDVVRGMLS